MTEVLDDIARCIPALRRYARALTHDRELADDLVQDCLERAIRKRALFRPLGPVRSWLFSILVNVYRNEMRHRRHVATLPLQDLPADIAGPDPQPGRLALAETARAMAQLPREQREALILVVVEGMAYAEAAKVLAIPVGTLMSRLGRARATLRQLTGEGGAMLRAVK